MELKPEEEMEWIIATDVGSTTTKARLFRKTPEGWRFERAGEAPTTVEAPYEDVTLGVRNAIREVEELTKHLILDAKGTGMIKDTRTDRGVDLYCTTSSAGGGLQMIVTGLIGSMTGESANRAALGAGAIVMDILARDDGRANYEKIRTIRSLRPDILLVSGGVDGGNIVHVMELAELVASAKPKPRFGISYVLPAIYAGNKVLRPRIKDLMSKDFAISFVENIRPTLEMENTEPARDAIHEMFMEHVMSHAPGYTKLMDWTDIDILPTPAGEGIAVQLIAKTFRMNTIGVGLGGATTNIYSIVEGKFVRSVSANLGMSYSICNVMKEAGIENIMRWLPFEADPRDIGNRLMNKMIRPTTIPQSLEELILEHAVAREALRLGLLHHKSIATRLKGARVDQKTVDDLWKDLGAETYIDMLNIGIVVGTGGLLSHAPRRVQSMLCMVDAFQPEGVTRVFQDSVFMMPHLGVLSTVYEKAAWEIFDKDCLVRVGTVVAPRGTGREGTPVMDVTLEMPDGQTLDEQITYGEIKRIPLRGGEEAKAKISPRRGFDVGSGSGHVHESVMMGGEAGILLDGRGRPLSLPEAPEQTRALMLKWYSLLGLYPKEAFERLIELTN